MNEWAVAYTDGSSKGNPGDSGIGVVITDRTGRILKEAHRFIGTATNNVAEYSAVIFALSEVKSLGIGNVEIRTDSELLYSQLIGKYRIKDAKLVKAAMRCMKLLRGFTQWKVTLIPREENRRADRLARSTISKRKGQVG